jgi:hypothetical protein
MSELEVCLFDAGRGVLTPLCQGSAIRIHTHMPGPLIEPVELGSMRPFAVYELLRRMLEQEELAATFVSAAPTATEITTIFAPLGDRAPRGSPTASFSLAIARDRALGERQQYVELVLSGADGWRDEQSQQIPRSSLRFDDAQEEFGYPALVLYLLGAHYSQPLTDPLPGLSEARARGERIREIAMTLLPEEPSPPDMRRFLGAFRLCLASDLDTPGAFRAVFAWLRAAELRDEPVGDGDLREMLALLELEELLHED